MHVCLVHVGLVLALWCDSCLPCCRRQRNNLNEPLDPFPFFGWLLNKKAARVEVNRPISLAFLHWVRITLHPWPFVSDIAIVLKRDVKLQLTNFSAHVYCGHGRPSQLMLRSCLQWLQIRPDLQKQTFIIGDVFLLLYGNKKATPILKVSFWRTFGVLIMRTLVICFSSHQNEFGLSCVTSV